MQDRPAAGAGQSGKQAGKVGLVGVQGRQESSRQVERGESRKCKRAGQIRRGRGRQERLGEKNRQAAKTGQEGPQDAMHGMQLTWQDSRQGRLGR